jgi:hypothetical protein
MNKGVALYLAVIVMALLLIIVFGLSILVKNQVIMVRDTEESVVALYAADSGIEKFLIDAIHNMVVPDSSYAVVLGNGSSYSVSVACCKYTGIPTPGCSASAAVCGSLAEDASCGGRFYCAKSVGAYRGTTRGVSVSI